MITARENASLDRDNAWLARRLRDRPEILHAINRSRSAQGMDIIAPWQAPSAGPAAAPSGARREPVREPARLAGTRVWIMCCPGVAPGRLIKSVRDERINDFAFGRAAELNTRRDWHLRLGHHGEKLAIPGPTLRAIETRFGLALEWRPDESNHWHRAVVEEIERGNQGVSVAFTNASKLTIQVAGRSLDYVTRATLTHVAIAIPSTAVPAYSGGTAIVTRRDNRSDADIITMLELKAAGRA
jgi:phage head maturation protease